MENTMQLTIENVEENYESTFNEYLVQMAPKIELHAHLNGCVRQQTLEDFAQEKGLQLDFSCFDRKDNEGQFCTVKTLKDIQRLTREVLIDFKEQNVVYLEIRTTPKDCENGTFNMQQYIQTILNVITQFNEEENQTMQTRLLLSIDRGRSLEHASKVLELLIQFRQTSPYVVGLDFSGNPEKNKFSDFKTYFDICKQMGIKTTIHTAVIEGDEVMQETSEIVNFVPDRVGHFNYYDNNLYEQIISKGIPIELCPTSNYFTKGLNSMQEHHFKDFFFKNHPVSLSTDDTGVFCTNTTQEHMKIIQTFKLDIYDLKKLLLTSSTMIFDETMKESLQRQIEQYFERISS